MPDTPEKPVDGRRYKITTVNHEVKPDSMINPVRETGPIDYGTALYRGSATQQKRARQALALLDIEEIGFKVKLSPPGASTEIILERVK